MFKILLLKNGRNPNAGVARSSTIIAETLESLGNIVTTSVEPKNTNNFDIIWFYGWFHSNNGVSGKGRDIARLKKVLSEDGPPVLFNAAYNGKEERAEWILDTLAKYPRAIAVVWTGMAKTALEYHPRVIQLPKAFRTDIPEAKPFGDRQSYCIGDIADFGHSHITGMKIKEMENYIQNIKEALPEVKISGYQGWSNKIKTMYGVDAISKQRNSLLEFLAKQKAVIHFGKYESFAMTLMEAQAVGTPVIYPHMPQSITEYIGPTGFIYNDISDIIEAIKVLEQKKLWELSSMSSIYNATARSAQLHGPVLHHAIQCAINHWNTNVVNHTDCNLQPQQSASV